MTREGLASLFPMTDIAVMGLWPVLARLPTLIARIRRTAEAAIAERPDMILLIDSPDFCHRVARRIRAALPDVPIVLYVSPTVWFWRPGRARRIARFCTRLLALLPFEPAVHQRLDGPETIYVGHPFIERVAACRNQADWPPREGDPLRLLVLPGSRRSEVSRLMADFGATVARLAALGPLHVTIPVVEHVRPLILASLADWPITPTLVSSEADKFAAFASAHAALSASGTATLELSLAGVPTVAAYRLDWLGQRVKHFIKPSPALADIIRVRSAQLTNVILGDMILPEFIDDDVTPANLAAALMPLLTNPEARQRQIDAFTRLRQVMQPNPGVRPSDAAAQAILDLWTRIPGPTAGH